MKFLIRQTAVVLGLCALAACGGGGGGGPGDAPAPPAYSLGGTVSGLAGTVALGNGAASVVVAASGAFTFGATLANGAAYNVTVTTQPAGQTCTVRNGAGTITGANVGNVAVECTSRSYSVGGAIVGLAGTVELLNNGSDALVSDSNGAFTFTTPVAHGAAYDVTVRTQPSGQTCSAANGSGTVNAANVTGVIVVCAVSTYTIGGTVTGLAGTVSMQNNGGDTLAVGNNGAFAFATALAHGTPYAITVLAQPAGQVCAVANGSGTATANVTGVAVTCVAQLALLSTDPANGASGVEPAVAPSLTFSTAIDAATVTTSNVMLGRPTQSIVGGVATVAGPRVLFTPTLPLGLFSTYTLTAGTGLRGAGGEALAAPVAVSFRTRDGAWGGARRIDSETASAGKPHVAFGRNGDAVAVWQQSDGTRTRIWASSYAASTALWSAAQVVARDDRGDAAEPRVAVDRLGNAIAVWQHFDGVRLNVWTSRYTQATGTWGTAQLLEADDTGDAQHPQVAIDFFGDALAAWRQFDGTRFVIRASRYVAGTGTWETPQQVGNTMTSNAGPPQLSMATGGGALVVWRAIEASTIFGNEHTVGMGPGGSIWRGLVRLSDAGGADDPHVAVDPASSGTGQLERAIVVWRESGGGATNIRARRFERGWREPERVEAHGAGDVRRPQAGFASGPVGSGIVAWEQSDGMRFNLWAASFDSGGWRTPRQIETDDLGNAELPQVVRTEDGSGNAMAVWQQFDGVRTNILAARYAGETDGWSPPQAITSDPGASADARIAIDPRGRVVAVWTQPDGANRGRVWANVFR